MKNYKLVYTFIVVLTAVLLAVPAFAQDDKQPAGDGSQTDTVSTMPSPVAETAAPAATAQAPIAEENPAIKEQSIYGEVQNIDAAASTMTVQYYDYDSDEEKTIDIASDKDTKIENAAAMANIAKNDWVDVTYAQQGGKNVAKSIVVEKEEKDEAIATTDTEVTSPAMPSER